MPSLFKPNPATCPLKTDSEGFKLLKIQSCGDSCIFHVKIGSRFVVGSEHDTRSCSRYHKLIALNVHVDDYESNIDFPNWCLESYYGYKQRELCKVEKTENVIVLISGCSNKIVSFIECSAAWDAFRNRKGKDYRPLFASKEFSNCELRCIPDLSGSIFRDCYFNDCYIESGLMDLRGLPNSAFYQSYLNPVEFKGVNLSGSLFEETTLHNCIFDNCNLSGTTFSNSSLRSVIFDRCNLENIKFDNSEIINVYFCWNDNFKFTSLNKSKLIYNTHIDHPDDVFQAHLNTYCKVQTNKLAWSIIKPYK